MRGECWEWYGSRNRGGYGRSGKQRRGGAYLAHRWVYESLAGPIPEGMTLDHLCCNPGCVNPEHLEVVTSSENTLRNGKRGQTHCLRGHLFDVANTRVSYDTKGRAHRSCRECQRLRDKERRK